MNAHAPVPESARVASRFPPREAMLLTLAMIALLVAGWHVQWGEALLAERQQLRGQRQQESTRSPVSKFATREKDTATQLSAPVASFEQDAPARAEPVLSVQRQLLRRLGGLDLEAFAVLPTVDAWRDPQERSSGRPKLVPLEAHRLDFNGDEKAVLDYLRGLERIEPAPRIHALRLEFLEHEQRQVQLVLHAPHQASAAAVP